MSWPAKYNIRVSVAYYPRKSWRKLIFYDNIATASNSDNLIAIFVFSNLLVQKSRRRDGRIQLSGGKKSFHQPSFISPTTIQSVNTIYRIPLQLYSLVRSFSGCNEFLSHKSNISWIADGKFMDNKLEFRQRDSMIPKTNARAQITAMFSKIFRPLVFARDQFTKYRETLQLWHLPDEWN